MSVPSAKCTGRDAQITAPAQVLVLHVTGQEAGLGRIASKWRCWHFTHSLTQSPSSVCLPLSPDDSLFPRHWFSWSVSLERASPRGMPAFWECGGGEPLSSHFLVLLPAFRDLLIKGCLHTIQGPAFVSSFMVHG